MNAAHELAKEKGWWKACTVDGRVSVTLVQGVIPEKLMLIVTEASEAMEDYRNHKLTEYNDENGKPCGLPTELADIVIRTMDLAGALGIDLQAAVTRKHEYNKTREQRHGGKRA